MRATDPATARYDVCVRFVTIAALLLAITGTAAAMSPATTPTRPALALADLDPITLRGVRFKPGERVTIRSDGVARTRRASAAGQFVIAFPLGDPCDFSATAIGARGSRATYKLPAHLSERICPLP